FDGVIKHKLAVELQYDVESFNQTQWQDQQQSTYYGNSDAQNWSLSLIDQSHFFDERLLITAGVRFDAYERESDHFKQFN
ncbi:TonB-dependent receptor domain-containing protein, partial [Salmonella sp. ZJJH19_0069]